MSMNFFDFLKAIPSVRLSEILNSFRFVSLKAVAKLQNLFVSAKTFLKFFSFFLVLLIFKERLREALILIKNLTTDVMRF